MAQKIIRVNESALVDVIEKIVTEAVSAKKKEWIAEQTAKQDKIIAERIDKILEDRIKKLFENKK